MKKYKNKQGIELSYSPKKGDSHTELVKEVVSEAVNMLKRGENKSQVVDFLKINFNLEEVCMTKIN